MLDQDVLADTSSIDAEAHQEEVGEEQERAPSQAYVVSEPPSLGIVLNPAAAGGEAGRMWPRLEAALRHILGPFAVLETQGPGDATTLTRRALSQGVRTVASLGGDGTHNETLNGFFEGGKSVNPEGALAILPMGTGGDFRKSLGLESDVIEAALHMQQSRRRKIDVGHIRFLDHDGAEAELYFLNIASFGLSGLVDKKVNNASKALGGRASFVLGTVRALREYEPQKVRLVVHDRLAVQFSMEMVAVANGRYFGGGMKIAPYAKIDDGFFNTVVVREMTLSERAVSSVRVYQGRHFESSKVSHLQAQKLYAEPMVPGEDVLLDVDGEAPGRLPATFTVLPGALWLRG